MREERKKLGYAQNDSPEYVLKSYENEQNRSRAIELVNNADVVIAGAPPNDMLKMRIKKGKLLLRYMERPYKIKASFTKRIYHFLKWHQNDLWSKNVYLLCAGAYTAYDYSKVFMYKDRMFKWGYFPAVKKHSIDSLLDKKKKTTLLWCGRFIDWKHPDDAIYVAKKLKEKGYNFDLNIIGTGVMEDELKNMVNSFNLSNNVHFLGSMPTEQVRIHMEEAGVYLFTSDRQEGWGAVLNESMNSGCTVVANHAIGSVPYLLTDNKNGLIYESGNQNMLVDKVKYILDNPNEQSRLGKEAYNTIVSIWNAQNAVDRLLSMTEHILNENSSVALYQNGPCSKAEIIVDNWFKEKLG